MTDTKRNLQEHLRHVSEYWSQYQADGIDARIPPDSTHTSAIEARKYTALARAAKTELEAARYIQDALVHWKDFELFDAAIRGDVHSKNQSEKAKLPRSIIPGIKKNLVSKYPDYKAKELWPHLYAELDAMGLSPEENNDGPGEEWYAYDHKDGSKKISFRTFANIKINE